MGESTQRNGASSHGCFLSGVMIDTAVGLGGLILRTIDGGNNWLLQDSGSTDRLHGVSFTDEMTGTVVGGKDTILRTTTGGIR